MPAWELRLLSQIVVIALPLSTCAPVCSLRV
jgi:hypothetical protein